jgi:uncharacterized delta-60 repeat protein
VRLTAGGRLDEAFGMRGVVRTAFSGQNDFGNGLALQADGRIVLVGEIADLGARDFGIARYLVDGSLDASFGTAGLLQVDFFGDIDIARDVVLQADGKIVVGGSAKNGAAAGLGVVRALP